MGPMEAFFVGTVIGVALALMAAMPPWRKRDG